MKPKVIARRKPPIDRFLRSESTSSILLLVLTVAALVIANSGLSESYFHFLETPLTLPIGDLTRPLVDWISEGLMTIFFFVVGLEIKRELISGALSTWKHATLPVFGAIGGMVVPALLFLAFNYGTANISGWGIPMVI